MTRDVVCAREDTPYKELVRLLATRRMSAVPVVDGRRRVLGVVSEADLLLKQEHPARRAVRGCPRSRRSGPSAWPPSSTPRARAGLPS